jgi:predicted ATPase
LVLPVIAQAVGLVALGDQSPRDGLLHLFENRHFLLVLDNLEQVLPVAGELSDLLAHCPSLTMLITSREPLRIAGEREYPVPPLIVPNRLHNASGRFEAVELFVQRAQAVRPDFELTEENAGAVADICIKLDGLPLAIELAASRVKFLSPSAIRARLIDRLTLLRREGRDVPDRLRTMRDAIGWSYGLLTDEERALFRRLSVLAGGCTVETAAGMLGSEGDTLELFDRLTSLADKSLLVQVDQPNGEPRFRMFETIRAYGLEQLESHGEVGTTQRALADWLLQRTERSIMEMWGPKQGAWSAFFDEEIDNVRASLEWLLDTEDLDGASQLLLAASRYWDVRGNLTEAQSWTERTIQLDTQRSAPARNALVSSSCWHGMIITWAIFIERFSKSRCRSAARLRAAIVGPRHRPGTSSELFMPPRGNSRRPFPCSNRS